MKNKDISVELGKNVMLPIERSSPKVFKNNEELKNAFENKSFHEKLEELLFKVEKTDGFRNGLKYKFVILPIFPLTFSFFQEDTSSNQSFISTTDQTNDNVSWKMQHLFK